MPRDERIYTEEDDQRLRHYLTGPDEAVFRDFYVAEHRNRAGIVIPLQANALQGRLADACRRARACNLRLEQLAIAEGGQSYIHNLAERTEKKETIHPHEIGLKMLVGKSRRGGCSTWVAHIGLRYATSLPNAKVLVMAHTDGTAVELSRYPRKTLDHWVLSDPIRPVTTRDNDNTLEFANGSRYSIRTAGMAKGKAASRGWGFDVYHFSEVAHYSSYTDYTQSKAVAQKHAWMFMESTANGAAGPFYDEWNTALYVEEVEQILDSGDLSALTGWSGQYRFFFSWLEDPGFVDHVFEAEKPALLRSLDEYEKTMMATDARFTLERVKFRRRVMHDMEDQDGLSPEQFFQQEYPASAEEMFQSTGSTAFERPPLQAMLQRAKAATQRRFVLDRHEQPQAVLRGENLIVYTPPRLGRSYVIGADIGKGLKKDFSRAVIFDRGDGTSVTQVASLYSNTMNPTDFAHVVVMVAEWYNGAFVVPEGSPSDAGVTFCQTIYEDIGYSNIYFRDDPTQTSQVYGGGSLRLGFSTTNQTKGYLVNAARSALREGNYILMDPEIIRQHLLFTANDGKYTAPEGDFDDGVIAGCLGVWGNRAKVAPRVPRKAEEKARAEARAAANPQDRALWAAVNAAINQSLRRTYRTRRRGDVLPPVDGEIPRG